MKNITSKKQLFLDFGRDYDASLSNFFFSKANEIIKNEIHSLMQSTDKSDLFIYGENAAGKTFLLNSILNDAPNNSQTIYIDLSKLNEFCSGNNYNDFRTNISETINWIKNTK